RLSGTRRGAGRLGDGIGVETPFDEDGRGLLGDDRAGTDTGESDARPGDTARRAVQRNGHTGGGEVADTALHLEIATLGLALGGRDDGGHRDLVVGEGVLERPDRELLDGDDPL